MMTRNAVRIDEAIEQNIASLHVEGELDLASGTHLINRIESLAARGWRHFALDLNKVDFIDSYAMSLIVKLHEDIRARRGTLRIVTSSPSVDRILGLMRLQFMRLSRG